MDSSKRRPIKARSVGFFHKAARYLKDKSVTPNQVSLASIAFAAFAAFSIYFSITHWLFAVLAILGILGRLICNLLDGMIAVEGGLSTPTGEIYNEAPDRVSDTLIILGFGLAMDKAGILGGGIGLSLGMLVAFAAMATAYIRLLGISCGAKAYFSGPMAKQHRMALSMFTLILLAFFPGIGAQIVLGLLLLMLAGCLWTIIGRLKKIQIELNTAHQA